MPKRSYFVTCENAQEINKLVLKHRKQKPLSQIYKMIQQIDPKAEIPAYQCFVSWMRNFEKEVRKSKDKFLGGAEVAAINDIDFINRAMQKASEIGDLVLGKTLEEIKEKIDNGEEVPWNIRVKVMKWFSDASKSIVQQNFLNMKLNKNSDNLKALAMLANSIRYQKMKPQDFSEEDIIEGQYDETTGTKEQSPNSQVK